MQPFARTIRTFERRRRGNRGALETVILAALFLLVFSCSPPVAREVLSAGEPSAPRLERDTTAADEVEARRLVNGSNGRSSAGEPAARRGSAAKRPERRADEERPVERTTFTRSRGDHFASEELVDFGELGLIPAVVESFRVTQECDFDDPFGRCR